MKSIYFLFVCISLFFSIKTSAQVNLLVNGGAEAGDPSTTGWNVVNSGSNCYNSSGWRVAETQNGFPDAEEGTYIFYPGCGGTGEGETYEINQDVNVNTYAAAIDAGTFLVTFSGYTQSYDQSTPDATDIIVEYRDASNTTVLGSYNTGTATNLDAWMHYTDIRNAPAGTRYIRVRLIGTSNNGSSIDSYFDNISLTSPSVLPVHFVSFTAALENGNVLLKWNINNEENTKGYNVQVSRDGKAWSLEAFVQAKNTPGNISYSYIDNTAKNGTIYYRLQQVNDDNQFSYSDIKVLYPDNSGTQVTLYPNPTASILFIESAVLRRIEIIDPEGKIVMKSAAMANGSLNISQLGKGTYWVKLIGSEDTIVKKIEKN